MVTTVVNVKTHPYTRYIGRPGIMGNFYVIGRDGTREECIEKYRETFNKDEALKKFARENLWNEILGCYCKPLACHGDVIAEYLNGLKEDEKRTASS